MQAHTTSPSAVTRALVAPLPMSARSSDVMAPDRKSTRLNSSHSQISYAVICLKKKTHTTVPVRAMLFTVKMAVRSESLERSIGKLAVAGEQTGFTVEQMIKCGTYRCDLLDSLV